MSLQAQNPDESATNGIYRSTQKDKNYNPPALQQSN